jgi:hypothetical protein
LNNLINKKSLITLNGRSQSDAYGNFTHTSRLKNKTDKNISTATVIDLCICNINTLYNFNDFEVLNWTESDHFPILIKQMTASADFNSKNTIERKTVFKWNKEKFEDFRCHLQRKLNLSKENHCDIDKEQIN